MDERMKEETRIAIAGLEDRVEMIDDELASNPDFERPDDYYSCKLLAKSLREELKEAYDNVGW